MIICKHARLSAHNKPDSATTTPAGRPQGIAPTISDPARTWWAICVIDEIIQIRVYSFIFPFRQHGRAAAGIVGAIPCGRPGIGGCPPLTATQY